MIAPIGYAVACHELITCPARSTLDIILRGRVSEQADEHGKSEEISEHVLIIILLDTIYLLYLYHYMSKTYMYNG